MRGEELMPRRRRAHVHARQHLGTACMHVHTVNNAHGNKCVHTCVTTTHTAPLGMQVFNATARAGRLPPTRTPPIPHPTLTPVSDESPPNPRPTLNRSTPDPHPIPAKSSPKPDTCTSHPRPLNPPPATTCRHHHHQPPPPPPSGIGLSWLRTGTSIIHNDRQSGRTQFGGQRVHQIETSIGDCDNNWCNWKLRQHCSIDNIIKNDTP